jgi:hypothetical protein
LQSLRGATPREVEARLGGKADHVTRTASQGQVVEQWIYYRAAYVDYVNFARSSGDTHPRVITFYSRRRTAADPPTNP